MGFKAPQCSRLSVWLELRPLHDQQSWEYMDENPLDPGSHFMSLR